MKTTLLHSSRLATAINVCIICQIPPPQTGASTFHQELSPPMRTMKTKEGKSQTGDHYSTHIPQTPPFLELNKRHAAPTQMRWSPYQSSEISHHSTPLHCKPSLRSITERSHGQEHGNESFYCTLAIPSLPSASQRNQRYHLPPLSLPPPPRLPHLLPLIFISTDSLLLTPTSPPTQPENNPHLFQRHNPPNPPSPQSSSNPTILLSPQPRKPPPTNPTKPNHKILPLTPAVGVSERWWRGWGEQSGRI